MTGLFCSEVGVIFIMEGIFSALFCSVSGGGFEMIGTLVDFHWYPIKRLPGYVPFPKVWFWFSKMWLSSIVSITSRLFLILRSRFSRALYLPWAKMKSLYSSKEVVS